MTNDLLPLSADQLTAGLRIGDSAGMRGSRDQGLAVVPGLLREIWDRSRPPISRREGGDLVVLGLDGIRLDQAEAHWHQASALRALTSTFPSTSAVAWLTATTGLHEHEHEVPGVLYYAEPFDGMFNPIRDQGWTLGADWERRHPADGVAVGPWRTIFHELAEEGADCVVPLNELDTVRGRWTNALLGGARHVASTVAWESIRSSPQRMVSRSMEAVEVLLAQGDRSQMIWTWMNLDDYVHRNGYDGEMSAALSEIEAWAVRAAERGVTVVAHSDHGLVENRITDTVTETFDRLTGRADCLHLAGGAGRVRWAYPKVGREERVRRQLEDAFGDQALVLHRDELSTLGLTAPGWPDHQVGEVVLVATGDKFPVPIPSYTWEHGSILPGEMLCPFAVWSGDH